MGGFQVFPFSFLNSDLSTLQGNSTNKSVKNTFLSGQIIKSGLISFGEDAVAGLLIEADTDSNIYSRASLVLQGNAQGRCALFVENNHLIALINEKFYTLAGD